MEAPATTELPRPSRRWVPYKGFVCSDTASLWIFLVLYVPTYVDGLELCACTKWVGTIHIGI